MTRRQWTIVSRIYTKAAALNLSKRRVYLDDACRNKDEIRREVESLLAQGRRSGPFLGVHSSPGGKILSHYRVLDQIGRGGMGHVYKARDVRLDRVVAIKSLPPWAMGDPRSQKRLLEEARAASALNHPNIVTIHEIIRRKREHFIVMEYVVGESLYALVPSRGLPVPRALDLALQICNALKAAHAAGVLHGDLKPSNIIVTEDHRAKLLDFGVARRLGRATQKREFGTKEYMAPEQYKGTADERSEVFSFGLILYEMLCGRHAFGRGTPDQLRAAIRTNAPRPLRPKIPVRLARIVEHCLEKNPENRFQSMRDLLDALNPYLEIAIGSVLKPSAKQTTAEPDYPWRQLRSEISRMTYQSLAASRGAFAAVTRLLENTDSTAARRAVISAMRDLIMTTLDTDGNVPPRSVREVRKLALELMKLGKPGDLKACFEDGDLEHLDLYGMDFTSQELSGMSFRGSFLVEADLGRSNLAHTSFAGAYIRNANFTNADLSGVDLTDADWFNALALTQAQLAHVREDTLMDCPATVAEMHRYLEKHYALPFESWSGWVRDQLTATWNEYLKPGGLRDFVAQQRRKSSR